MKFLSVTILGSGNVAAFLCRNLSRKGIHINRIVARNEAKGKLLAAASGALYQKEYSSFDSDDSKIIISAIKDSAAQEVWSCCSFGDALVLHTAGTLPLSALTPFARNCGVLYPLQSISALSLSDSEKVPFLIEANTPANLQKIKFFAKLLSPAVRECSSEARKKLHLAAVFANNFSNLCFHIAWDLAEKEGIDPKILLPLIEESCAKLRTLSPAQSQTGPAVRGDENVMQKHLELLADQPETAAFYRLASAEIARRKK